MPSSSLCLGTGPPPPSLPMPALSTSAWTHRREEDCSLPCLTLPSCHARLLPCSLLFLYLFPLSKPAYYLTAEGPTSACPCLPALFPAPSLLPTRLPAVPAAWEIAATTYPTPAWVPYRTCRGYDCRLPSLPARTLHTPAPPLPDEGRRRHATGTGAAAARDCPFAQRYAFTGDARPARRCCFAKQAS